MVGKDLDKRLKSAGFKTLILTNREPTKEEKTKAFEEKGLCIMHAQSYEKAQLLDLYINPKEFEKAKKVIDKFQLIPVKGKLFTSDKGWDSKQIQATNFNSGDIYNAGDEPHHGRFHFIREKK